MSQGHTGDARGALRRWYDSIGADGRFAGWFMEFHPGGAHAGAGAWVDFVHEDVAAQLCTWPSGCIGAYTMRIPEAPEPVCGQVEVDSEEAIGVYARNFEERVLALLDSCATSGSGAMPKVRARSSTPRDLESPSRNAARFSVFRFMHEPRAARQPRRRPRSAPLLSLAPGAPAIVDLVRAQPATGQANGEALGPANTDNVAGGTEGSVVGRRRAVVERLRVVRACPWAGPLIG